jgi:hypothetical protein
MANTSTDLRSAGVSRAGTSDDQIRPFRIEIPQEDLDDLRERLARMGVTACSGPTVMA